MTAPRLLVLAVSVGLATVSAAPGASAQDAPAEARGSQVDVVLDPFIPISGRPVRAAIRFTGAQPEAASAFVRPVGEATYQELVAVDEGGGVWTVALPFDAPPQGIEAYAQYRLDGATLTEPTQNPEAAPFRIPTFSLLAESDVVLPARQYRMVTVPLLLDGPDDLPLPFVSDDPVEVFGDDFGETGDPSQWRLLRWDPGAERYRDAVADAGLFEPIRLGSGYWLISASGGPFDVAGGLSAGVRFEGATSLPAPVTVPLLPGWNQIGSPFLVPIAWADVGRPAGVEDPVAFRQGSFVGVQAALAPWEGYFVFNPGGASSLEFRLLPPAGTSGRSVAERLHDRAGLGAGVLSVRATSGAATDEVVLGLFGAAPAPPDALPTRLRKPPPVDGGLRLAAHVDGEEWLGHVQTREDATWTLTLAAPPSSEIELRLEAHGDWPDSLVVEDLDRGVRLAASAGRVVVPALAGVATRRLRLRAGDAAEPAHDHERAFSLGAPRPNPSAGVVTVPYTLAASGPTRLDIVDVLGRTVRVLHVGEQDAGSHTVAWDGHDASGQPAAAGVYLVRLRSGSGSAAVRVTRLR